MIGDESQLWPHRQSLIACWNHEAAGSDLSGAPVPDLQSTLQADGLILDPGLSGNPFCIPRACRMTRVCAHYYSFTGESHTITVDLLRDTDCSGAFSTIDSFSFVDSLGDGTRVCHCDDVSVLFDECDQWYPLVTFSGTGAIFPVLRLVFHFELR